MRQEGKRFNFKVESRSLLQWCFDLTFYRRSLILIPLHVVIFTLSYFCAYCLRFGWPWFMSSLFFINTLPAVVLLRVLAFAYFRIFHGVLRYTSYSDVIDILKAIILGSAGIMFYSTLFVHPHIPPTVILIDLLLVVSLSVGARMFLRYVRLSVYPFAEKTRTLVVGGLYDCQYIVSHLKDSKYSSYFPVACLDTKSGKKGVTVHGVPVAGNIDDARKVITKYNVEVVLISSETRFSGELNLIVEECSRTGVTVKIIPQLGQFFDSLSTIRDISIEDLVNRKTIDLDERGIQEFIRGRRILVTGAGGSIGRELCLHVAKYSPGLMVLVERFENNLYRVEMDLREHFPLQNIRPILATINDFEGLHNLLRELEVNVVFHCAAHKHVPILEVNPIEAGYNNVLGTRNVALAADKTGVEKFIMVSTDKAVRPTSVMGASKRVAEMFVQSLNEYSRTQYITIRFGNVLDSEGSVVPLFREQIRKGGPVTVTHPEIERFFMTIPEACQLVLQAASMGNGGEIFVLNMGNQVKILDIAKKMIVLSGQVPYEEIPIEFIGLRKGEKFKEELFNLDEKRQPTGSDHIWICDSKKYDYDWLVGGIQKIEEFVRTKDVVGVIRSFREIVPHCTCGNIFLENETAKQTGRQSKDIFGEDLTYGGGHPTYGQGGSSEQS